MCIYCGTLRYRKIYESHYGIIPKDNNNRSYEIHHIDGDHSNNDPSNLAAVSIQEHYNIHYQQEDWGACFLLSQKMKMNPKEIARLNALQNSKRIQDRTHNLIKREDGTSHASDRVEQGNHHWLKREDGSSVSSDRVKNGTHSFLTANRDFDLKVPKKKTIYKWRHLDTGETVDMTMYDFIKTYSLQKQQGNISGLVKGRFTHIKRWQIVLKD